MRGFWMFLLIMVLLLPLTLLLFGYLFYYKTPKNMNGRYGYHSKMSCKNWQTWQFAHECCGKLWMLAGTAMLPVSVGCMIMVLDADVDTAGVWSCVLVALQCIFFVAAVPVTEWALRKNFDKNGMRKEK